MSFECIINWITCIILGVVDSCALQRLFPPFIVSWRIRQDFVKSTCLNGVIFLTSAIFLEYYFPLLMKFILPPSNDKTIIYYDEYVHFLINRAMIILWAYPIYCTSTLLGIVWNYAMIVETYTLHYGRSIPNRTLAQIINTLAEDIYNLLCTVVFFVQMAVVSYIPYIGTFILVCHLAWFYSLISFDYKWRFDSISLMQRFSIVEASWDYMLGFGLIPALITVFLPKFISMSLLAFISPLHGMLAVMSTIPEARTYNIPLFRVLRYCNIYLVKIA